MPDELLTSYVSRTADASGLRHSQNYFEMLISYIEDPIQHCLRLTAKTAGTVRRNYRTPKYYVYSKSRMKFCTNCKNEDINHLGFTYFRTCHQSPVVLLCPDHGTYLITEGMQDRSDRVWPGYCKVSAEFTTFGLQKIATIVRMLHRENRTSFETRRIKQHIKSSTQIEQDCRHELIRKSFGDKIDVIAKKTIGIILYSNYSSPNIYMDDVLNRNLTQEELIVYYCFFTKNPGVDHFRSLID